MTTSLKQVTFTCRAEQGTPYLRYQTLDYLWLSGCQFCLSFPCRSKIVWKKYLTWRLPCSTAGSFFCCSAHLFPCVYPLTSPCMWRSQSVTSVWRSTLLSAWGFATQGYVQKVFCVERKDSHTSLGGKKEKLSSSVIFSKCYLKC